MPDFDPDRPGYAASRRTLLILTILTAVNVILPLLGMDLSFLFSAFFPLVAAWSAPYGFLGFSKWLCILFCCALPTLAFLLCYVVSAEKRGGLIASAVLFLADTVFMGWFIATNGFDADYIMNIVFHLFVLGSLISGTVASIRPEEATPPRPVRTRASAPAAAEATYDSSSAETQDAPAAEMPSASVSPAAEPQIFRYDRDYAAENRATPGRGVLRVVGSILLLLAAFIASALLFTAMSDAGVNDDVGVPVMLVLWLACLAVFIVRMVRLSPFLEAWRVSYTVDEAGFLTQVRSMELARLQNKLHYGNLRLIEARRDRFRILYETGSGRVRKAVIPNAYPGLAEYLADFSEG